MKKSIFFLFSTLLLICFIMTMRFFMNETAINNYYNGNYDNNIYNFLIIFNFPQPYVAHYNKGNNLYYSYDYEGAIKEYDAALKHAPANVDKRCQIYNNIAQAMIKQLDPNDEFYISELEYIQKILEREGCASQTETPKNGNSQDIWQEIEDEKKKKEESKLVPDDEGEPFNPDEYDGLEDDLDKQQEETSKEREKGQQGKYNPYNPKW